MSVGSYCKNIAKLHHLQSIRPKCDSVKDYPTGKKISKEVNKRFYLGLFDLWVGKAILQLSLIFS